MSVEMVYRRWQVLQLALAKPENYSDIGIRTQKNYRVKVCRVNHFAMSLYSGDIFHRPL